MSRSDYSYELDNWSHIRYRGAVNSAAKGKRGQQFFKELLLALDAMQEKKLIAHELESSGQFCAIGVLGNARKIDMSKIDPNDIGQVSNEFDIAQALAREVVFTNDEDCLTSETPDKRWIRMRRWVDAQIVAV